MASFLTISINNYYLYYNKNEPKYILNNNKELLIGQLLDFAIHHVCEHLNIPIYNELGIVFPNNYLFNMIQEYKIKLLPNDCEICKKIGIHLYPKIKNNFAYNNIGGNNKNALELDVSQNYLNLQIEPSYISDTNNIPIELPIDSRFLHVIDQKEKFIPEKKTFLKGLIEKIQKERHTIGLDNIQKGTTYIEKIGKIDYSINSSYIDTIIMLSYLPFENTFFENIYNIELRLNKLTQPSYISLHFKTLTRSNLVPKLLDCNAVFKQYREKILQGEILNVQKLRISLQTNFHGPNILKHPYYLSKNTFPIYDFYKDFLKLNLIETYPYTTLNKVCIDRQNSNVFSGIAIPIPIEDIVETNLEGINQNTEHIGFEIRGDILKYLITRDRYKQPAESRIYCPICNEFINRFDKKHMSFHKSNKILLSEVMNLKIDIITDIVIPKDNISIVDNMYFENKNPDTLFTLHEAINQNIVSKYERAIFEYSIFNTNCISFFINRYEKIINKQSNMEQPNHFVDIPVEIENNITDKNNNVYTLNAIITGSLTNTLLFFKLENIWYIYNNMYDPDLQPDYIQIIGTFDDLVKYRQGIIQTTGLIYFYLLQQ